ncbi:MAG: 50S ribosomal protein L6 [Candidatus Thermoplasmatota archaeon]|nr:50S ribosomal protein L6 [Candidatus Thermoplasmatota archaeon]
MAKVDKISKTIPIPEGVTASLKGDVLHVKGKKGELMRTFRNPRLSIVVGKGSIDIGMDAPVRFEVGLAGTWEAHVKNMIKGVTKGFEYKMRIIYSHFPIKTSTKGKELVIENFLGERFPRRANIVDGVAAKVSGDTVTLSGVDKEKVGQTAANIEKATRIKNYDPRVFQDGIYLVSRGDR